VKDTFRQSSDEAEISKMISKVKNVLFFWVENEEKNALSQKFSVYDKNIITFLILDRFSQI
jgi:hypothetical protein